VLVCLPPRSSAANTLYRGEIMNRQAAVAATFLVFILLPPAAPADVIHVDWAGGGDYLTIQEGIDAASEGDTVLVSCGTYCEHDVGISDGIYLTSETGFADCVTVNGEALGRVFACGGGTTVVGFTITNGRVLIPGEHTAVGGGMSCGGVPSPTIVRCTFIGNHAESYVAKGGGLFCGGSVTITDCVFTSNSTHSTQHPLWYRAPEGGGARIEGAATVSGCIFENNFAHCDCGGLYVAGGTITDCSFVGNMGYRDAGAFFCEHPCTLSNCVFTGNSSGNDAGAVWCYQPYPSDPVFTDCTFSGNSRQALLLSNSSAEITNCTFVGNVTPAIDGGGLSAVIQRTIVAFTEGGPGFNCPGIEFSITQCCVFGNAGGDSLCGDYYDNMFADPLFCMGEATLHDNSPCLPENNEWGELVGAHGAGGCGVSPVDVCFFATATSSESVVLRWTAASLDGIEGFEICRGTSQAGPFGKVNETRIPPASPGVYEDVTVWPGTTFWYELRAVLTDGSEEVVGGSAVSATTSGELLAALHPPRPNPFADEVRVQFDVSHNGEAVGVSVYNLRGQLVKMLVRRSPGRGRHEVVWDGTDAQGLPVSSGVYFLRLEVGEHQSTRRVLLMR
jgi:hypothetical protein